MSREGSEIVTPAVSSSVTVTGMLAAVKTVVIGVSARTDGVLRW